MPPEKKEHWQRERGKCWQVSISARVKDIKSQWQNSPANIVAKRTDNRSDQPSRPGSGLGGLPSKKFVEEKRGGGEKGPVPFEVGAVKIRRKRVTHC